MSTHLIKIIETATNQTVETMEADSRRSAERVQNGININLNHDDYYTVIESPDEKDADQ